MARDDEEHEDLTVVGGPNTHLERGGASACLIVLSGSSIGRIFRLSPAGHVIGRSADADIRLEDEGVSRHHARIAIDHANSIWLTDLQSTNGTHVNGQRISTHQLKDGDRVQIGETTILKFSIQDALEERFQEHLYAAVTRDPLTGAYNKRIFEEHLTKEFSHAKRHQHPLSLLMLDIDHFKKVNDTYGHLAGDHVLREVGHLLMRSVRNEDLLCRVGGEEFAVIARGSDRAGARMLGERLRSSIERGKYTFSGTELVVTISVGFGTFVPARHFDPEQLVAEADYHLYEAKRSGRNRVKPD